LASVLCEVRREGVDAILLQEVHYYADNWHDSRMGLSAVCNRLGWQAFACHGNHTDISAGCAVIIYNKSRTIKVSNNE
jgi:hypothetical protein